MLPKFLLGKCLVAELMKAQYPYWITLSILDSFFFVWDASAGRDQLNHASMIRLCVNGPVMGHSFKAPGGLNKIISSFAILFGVC